MGRFSADSETEKRCPVPRSAFSTDPQSFFLDFPGSQLRFPVWLLAVYGREWDFAGVSPSLLSRVRTVQYRPSPPPSPHPEASAPASARPGSAALPLPRPPPRGPCPPRPYW